MGKTTTYQLRSLPEDVKLILLKHQARLKATRGTAMISLESTIYHIVRDYDRCIKTSR